MCRCCQNCWEHFYWSCFEEKFCYDESIANYNPEDDISTSAYKNGGSAFRGLRSSENNNLRLPSPICVQPLHRSSPKNSNGKIHEEDYRREVQANMTMLGPEIMAVFANSQIFQEHQPNKINVMSTKAFLTGVHSSRNDLCATPKISDEHLLIKHLEEKLNGDLTDATTHSPHSLPPCAADDNDNDNDDDHVVPEKRIVFTLTADSSPEGSQTLTPQKFDAIAEEDDAKGNNMAAAAVKSIGGGVILRPCLINRHPYLLHGVGGVGVGGGGSASKRPLRNIKSVPHLSVRASASETDIFSISGSGTQISMTPEVPSISYSNLPKNYEETPTIEKYRVSQSLYSIQTANAAKAIQDDYTMPRYFRRPPMMTQSTEVLHLSTPPVEAPLKEELRRPEKSKRLEMLRETLPPLLIHSVSFRRNRNQGKQAN